MLRWYFLAAVGLCVACTPNAGHIERITPLPSSSVASETKSVVPQEAASTPLPTTTAIPGDLVIDSTSTPLANNLPVGSAMQIAAATDTALQLTPRHFLAFDESPAPITFDEFYDGYNIRTGLILSDKLLSLDGKEVTIQGYMAPPLKPELDYFVLTRVRLAFCPFCSTAGDWPDDIALVYLGTSTTAATEAPVRITGRIEIGASVDQETGMVSLVRIYANELEILN